MIVRALQIVLVLVLLVSYVITLELLRKRLGGLTPVLGWLLGLGYFIVAPLLVITLTGGYTMPPLFLIQGTWGTVDLHQPKFFVPYLFIWLIMMLMLVAVWIFLPGGRDRRQPSQFAINPRGLKRVLLISGCLGITEWVITIWISGGIVQFLTSHWYIRFEPLLEQFGEGFVFMLRAWQANQVLFVASGAMLLGLQLRDRRIEWRWIAGITVFLAIEMLMSGNRIYIALFLMTFIACCWLLELWGFMRRFMLIVPLLLVFFSAWGAMRHNLTSVTRSWSDYMGQELGNQAVTTIMTATEGQDLLLLFHGAADFGDKYDWLYGLTYSKSVTFLVPRRFYPSKPDNYSTILARIYEPGEDTSLGNSAVGELFANFGYLSLFIGPAFTVLLLNISVRMTRNMGRRSMTPAIAFVTLIWFARTDFSAVAIILMLALVLAYILRLDRRVLGTQSPDDDVLPLLPARA